jgi:hypothetical protein
MRGRNIPAFLFSFLGSFMANHFLTEDKEKALAFGNFIAKNATWNLSTQEACDLTKHFAWFNSLVKKIEDNIFELQKVHNPPAEINK